MRGALLAVVLACSLTALAGAAEAAPAPDPWAIVEPNVDTKCIGALGYCFWPIIVCVTEPCWP